MRPILAFIILLVFSCLSLDSYAQLIVQFETFAKKAPPPFEKLNTKKLKTLRVESVANFNIASSVIDKHWFDEKGNIILHTEQEASGDYVSPEDSTFFFYDDRGRLIKRRGVHDGPSDETIFSYNISKTDSVVHTSMRAFNKYVEGKFVIGDTSWRSDSCWWVGDTTYVKTITSYDYPHASYSKIFVSEGNMKIDLHYGYSTIFPEKMYHVSITAEKTDDTGNILQTWFAWYDDDDWEHLADSLGFLTSMKQSADEFENKNSVLPNAREIFFSDVLCKYYRKYWKELKKSMPCTYAYENGRLKTSSECHSSDSCIEKEYFYDPSGRLTKVTYPSSGKINADHTVYVYDEQGLVIKESMMGGYGTAHSTTYQYTFY